MYTTTTRDHPLSTKTTWDNPLSMQNKIFSHKSQSSFHVSSFEYSHSMWMPLVYLGLSLTIVSLLIVFSLRFYSYSSWNNWNFLLSNLTAIIILLGSLKRPLASHMIDWKKNPLTKWNLPTRIKKKHKSCVGL